MEYRGKLYGKIGGQYFDTGTHSDDYDKLLEQSNKMNTFISALIVAKGFVNEESELLAKELIGKTQ